MTPEELPAYLDRMRQRVAERGPKNAAYAMARRFHEYETTDVLIRNTHPRLTRTPSAPGSPPALVTGALRRSLRLFPAVGAGTYRAMSKVIPQIIYARIQEMGGTIVPHGHPYLRFRGIGGKMIYARSVKLPARPYMRPGHRDLVRDGSLTRAAVAAVKDLIAGG